MADYIGDVNPNELTGGIEDDYINGMEGDDTLRGDGGNDTIYGDLGNDVLNGGAESDSLYGGASDDWIEGDEGNDMLNGGADNDILIGGAGNDTLDGGTGNDMIYGGSCYDGYGNDTYIFGRGYGQDVIFDYDGTSGNIDIIMFNANVTPADVSVKADGDGNLILSINGSDDTLTVAGYFSNPSNQIEEIRFSDGTIWDVNEIYRQEILSATENDDFIYGADQTDTISGLGGNDYIIGGAGNDTLGGDADADTLHGGDDNDSLIGGAGNDLLLGDGGDDTLDGGTGNDTLMGGDYYWGGYGNNTYIFGRGYGQDVIYDGGSHIILLNSDVTPTDDDISLGANSDGDLILYIGADTLTVAKYYEYSNYQQLQIQFQNENGEITTTWNPAEINVAPVVKKPFGGTVIVKEGSEYTLSIDLDAFIDFNVGDSLTYTATLADDSPLPAWVTFDPATLIFTGTPPDDSIGTWHIKVTATDTSGLSVSEYVDAIVVPEWAIFGTEDDDALPGTENNDIIVGLGGHDTLGGSETMYEGTGADTMYGGAGGDSYLVDDPGDVVIEFSGEGQGEGNDGVASMISYTLPNNVENLSLIGTADINGTGNDNPNMIIGNSGDNIISGGGGDDWLCGGLDTTGLLFGNLGDDTIIGGTGNDLVAGFGYNETFVFSKGDGQDVIFNCNPEGVDKIQFTEGISSTDPVFVRLGNDLIIYIDDNTVENDAGFFEPRTFGLGDALALGVDVIVLSDGQYLTREDILNIADAMSDINDDPSLDVWQKIDAMKSSQEYQDLLAASWHSSAPTPTAGDDVLYGTDGNDTINALGGHDIVYGLSGDDSLAGGAGNDTLYGASGNDTLNGGAGADVMIGGSGDDIYYVDNTGDVITENSNEGTDTIRSSVSYTISDNVENMTLTGTDAINGTGNVLDNRIIGNTAANTLSGEAGNDYLSGGAGDDQLLGGDGDDTLLGGTGVDVLTGGAGNDSLNGGDDDDQLLGGDGNDTLIGGAGSDVMIASIGNDSLNGGDGGDTLLAGDGNDTLNGGAGADVMIGGSGDDIYYVDNTGDVITENSNEGTDTIRSSVSYTISDNVENMTLTGTDAINGTGNVLDNRIIGNTAANTLSGEAGNDYLSGGAGDDQLLGGDGDDTLLGGTGVDVLTGGAGNDSLNGGDDDDQLLGGAGNDTLLGSAGSDILTGGVGNDLLNGGDGDDLLRGEDGDDTLVGGAGSDFMTGGAGNDTYYVDNGGDWITENAGTDIDIIRSSISYTISDNVENMTLTGTDAIDGTGNVLDNRIIGNTAANTLSGQAGNDYLSGGAGADILNGGEGNDTLTGGDGSDTYLFGNNDGRDRINETAGITGDIDALKLTEATITEPVIVKDGNNLYVFIDANNYVRVASEFQATNYGIERLEVSDGHYITRDDIQTIVDTMSAINDSGMGVIQKYNAMMESEQYQNILSESWQS